MTGSWPFETVACHIRLMANHGLVDLFDPNYWGPPGRAGPFFVSQGAWDMLARRIAICTVCFVAGTLGAWLHNGRWRK